MIRNFNYTGRRRIERQRVSVLLHDAPDGQQTFDAGLSLGGLELPGESVVYVEAYYRAAWMRFHFGTVNRIVPPEDRRLVGFARGSTVFFRVNVVDESGELGLIQATADGIRPVQPGEHAGRRSILPVDRRDLGPEIWRVNIEETAGPVLELNNRIPEVDHRARHDPIFIGLVYPSVLREVLTRAMCLGAADDDEDTSGWVAQWRRFARSLHPGPVPDTAEPEENRDEINAWVESVVRAFCARYKVLDNLLASISTGTA